MAHFKRHILFLLFIIVTPSSFSIERIVSLAPSLTKNVYLLKAEEKLVGCTSYCNIAENEQKTIIGSAIGVNLESVLLLKPDLVLATALTNPETIEMFKNLGVKVVVFPTPTDFSGICEQLIQLGQLIDKEALAKSIVAAEKNKVAAIKSGIPPTSSLKFFFQIGANPLFTVLTNTFMDDFIRFSGGENICKELTRGTVSRELVVLRNPDVILVSNMGEIGMEEKKIWESFSEMSAVKMKNVIVVDSDKSCSPTVTDFTETLQYIIESINYQ